MLTTGSSGGPAVPALLRELNERIVLEAVWQHAPVHRAELARITGLSKPTVSLSLQSLVSAGLVSEQAKDPKRASRAASFFHPVVGAGTVLTLDIGARFIRGRLTDLAGDSLAQLDLPLRRLSLKQVVATVREVADTLLTTADVRLDAVAAAVVGTPGIIDPDTGLVSETGALPSLAGVDLEAVLRDALQVEVMIENDVNLMALGEQAEGHGREAADFVVVSVGSGLGAGLVLRGELYRGAHGGAGEIDLVPFREVTDRPAYLVDPAADGVMAMAREAAGAARGSSLREPFEPSAVFGAARAGDEAAREVVRQEARAVAWYLAVVAAVVDVELVVIAGGIGVNGDLLLEPLREQLHGMLPFPPRVEMSTLGGGAVLAGAVAMGRRLARDRLFAARVVHDRS